MSDQKEEGAGMSDDLQMAASVCDHYWAWVSPAGTSSSARICKFCHQPDAAWLNEVANIEQQLSDLRAVLERLADEWEADEHSDLTQRACAVLLRARLAEHPASDGFWDQLDDGGLPVHMPMGVNAEGQGPEDDSRAHHHECWCGQKDCPLTRALAFTHPATPERHGNPPQFAGRYESCVLDDDGNCSRWNHDHPPATPAEVAVVGNSETIPHEGGLEEQATAEDREALAEVIWTTSRADESTISATGANIVADAILASNWLAAHDAALTAKARAEALREAADLPKSHALRCASCGGRATTTIVLEGFRTPVCLRHYNVWQTPEFDAHMCGIACLKCKDHDPRDRRDHGHLSPAICPACIRARADRERS